MDTFNEMKMEWCHQVEMRMDIYSYIHILEHHPNEEEQLKT